MKRIVTLLAFALLLGACDQLCGQDHEHKYSKKRRSAEPYWPVKICSLGDQTGESCVEYKAKKIIMEHSFFQFYDMDGDLLQYNNAGWSIIISPKVE